MKGSNILVKSKKGEIINIIADSTGGGTVAILEIDGCPLELCGDFYEVLIFFNKKTGVEIQLIEDYLKRKYPTYKELIFSEGSGRVSLLEIKSCEPFKTKLLGELKSLTGAVKISCLDPVYPVVVDKNIVPSFSTYDEMLVFIENNNCSLWEAAIEYESAISKWGENEIFDYAENLWETIVKSIVKGKEGNFEINGIVTPKAGKMLRHFIKNNKELKTIPMGILDTAVPISLAIMEYSNASDRKSVV